VLNINKLKLNKIGGAMKKLKNKPDGKRTPRFWEAATPNQTNYLAHLLNHTGDVEQKDLEAMFIKVSGGFLSLDALSKKEAGFLIDWVLGKVEPHQRKAWTCPRTAEKIGPSSATMPDAVHIDTIRNQVRTLGWSEPRFQEWLKKRTGVKHLNGLTSATALDAMQALFSHQKLQYQI
jgi:hypothetical protein